MEKAEVFNDFFTLDFTNKMTSAVDSKVRRDKQLRVLKEQVRHYLRETR